MNGNRGAGEGSKGCLNKNERGGGGGGGGVSTKI